jgi:hypothetical protein
MRGASRERMISMMARLAAGLSARRKLSRNASEKESRRTVAALDFITMLAAPTRIDYR